MSTKTFLNNLTIPTPCDADWDSMIGNDQVRFCHHCKLDVHNISQLTRSQAERLVARSNGRLCLRYRQDTKGRPVTLPVNQKLHRIGRRISRIAAGAFTATLSVSSAVSQQTSSGASETEPRPQATQPLAHWTLTSSVAGTVKDRSGVLITNATISISNKKLAQVFYTSTDDWGAFRVENLSAGLYTTRVEAPGFAAHESQVFLSENKEARMECDLQVAAIQENVEITSVDSVTIQGGVIVIVSPEDPFIKAAHEDDLETVMLLIAGRDVNKRDEQTKTTALEYAVKNGNREMLQMLILAGARVNDKNDSGETALMMFDDDATSDLIWDLINAGADVNLKDENGNTALIRAASVNNLEAVKTLVEAGAKLNHQNKFGFSALMQAAAEGDVNIVRALVVAGADINLLDEDGENALGLALENDHSAVVRYLKSRGATEVDKVQKEE